MTTDDQFILTDKAIDKLNLAWRALDSAADDLVSVGFGSAATAAREALVPVHRVATILEASEI